MPPKKSKAEKTRKSTIASRNNSRATFSEDSNASKTEKKKEKAKPLTKKERENMRKQEKALKERILQLRKEADQLLADLKATEEAAQRKAENENNEQTKRINLLTGTIENFRFAKLRLLHEHDKLREQEIWERYINTNQMPYPEVPSNMHTHMYLWKAIKSYEDIDFALPKCDAYISILNILDDLIDHPIYATKETLANWKETRDQWRSEFFFKIDKACFNMIKDLDANFEREKGDQAHTFNYEDWTDHLNLVMTAWLHTNSSLLRVSPKLSFPSINVHVVMPSAYRKEPFILRILFHDDDFLSDSSLTFRSPDGMRMEADMLAEVKRCFDAKAEAKSSVADRERERVRIAKQKVTDAQAAAQMAERSFETLQQKTKKPLTEEPVEKPEEPVKEPIKKKKAKDYVVNLEGVSDLMSGMSSQTGGKRPKGIYDEGGGGVARIMQSEGTQRALDAISMRSGMRKKVQERMKKVSKSSGDFDICTNIFYTHSMISMSDRHKKVEVKKDSELCFEDAEEESKSSSTEEESEQSFDSLELMFGKGDDDLEGCRSIKTLVRNTTIMVRDGKQRPAPSKSVASGNMKMGRKRGKSIASMKKLTEESDELQQTASEIYETKEDVRQESYMSSFVFTEIPNRRNHINLRAFSTVGGIYYIDVIFHESQPKTLKDGNTVQIFHGELNIKRDDYKYDYVPPPPAESDDPEVQPPIDHGLQHLLYIQVPLPKKVVFAGSQPVVAQWDRENKYWTRQHVYKYEIDFGADMATLNVGRVWPFAFLLEKFALLPFNKWVLKPKFETGGVSLVIQTQTMTFEFIVLNLEVCLSSVEGLSKASVIEDIVGVYMRVHKLIKIMKSRGLNLFPDEDTFLYVNDNSAKDPVLEDHAWMTLAMFSDALEFQSCQWNFDCKRRKLAFQVRECLAYNLELRLRTVTSTALSACLYRCSDEESLDESKIDNLGFCPDAYSLLEKGFAHATPTSALNPLQVITVYTLLSRTRIFSYCGFSKKDTTSSSSDTSKKSPKRRGKKPGKHQRGKTAKTPVGSRSSQTSLSLLFSVD